MVARLLTSNAIWTAVMAFLLFAAAGTLRWTAAWLFILTMAVLGPACGLYLAKSNPALLEERMKPPIQADQPVADKMFVVAFGVLGLAWLIIIGLDAGRYRISAMPDALQAFGFILILLASAVVMWVMLENNFAAPVVRIQRERGHRVITSGPYAWVRHPMYSGVIIFFAGAALMLGSWWGLAMTPLFAALFGIRATLEERVLRHELDGYDAYAARVRRRLVPGVW